MQQQQQHPSLQPPQPLMPYTYAPPQQQQAAVPYQLQQQLQQLQQQLHNSTYYSYVPYVLPQQYPYAYTSPVVAVAPVAAQLAPPAQSPPTPARKVTRPRTRRAPVVYRSDPESTSSEEVDDQTRDRTFEQRQTSDDTDFEADSSSSSYSRPRRKTTRKSAAARRPRGRPRRTPGWGNTDWAADDEQDLGPIQMPPTTRSASNVDNVSLRDVSSDSDYRGASRRRTRRSAAREESPTTYVRGRRKTANYVIADSSETSSDGLRNEGSTEESDNADSSQQVSDSDASSAAPVAAATQTIDRVLAYRKHVDASKEQVVEDETSCTLLEASNKDLGDLEEYSTSPLPGDVDMSECDFLIKWAGRSQLHNQWVAFQQLCDDSTAGLRKIENFYRRMNALREQREHMTKDEIEHQDVKLELQRQLDADSKKAERIIHGCLKDELPPEELPFHSTAEASTTFYLVKWLNCSYDQVTWETRETVENHGFQSLILEYEARVRRLTGDLSARQLLNHHHLCQTRFEPYTETPSYLTAVGELRDYQLTGVNWVLSRMKNNSSVLLADEMGLGKTVQTVAVCGHVLYAEQIAEPILIIVPQSTLDNWVSEFRQWLSDCNVIVFHGNAQARGVLREREMARVLSLPFSEPTDAVMQGGIAKYPGLRFVSSQTKRVRYQFDVCITTPSIQSWPDDLALLKSISWYLLVVDEAHLLKNSQSKRFKELDTFSTRYRFLLSGTPLHNNLQEMWSLLRFLSPVKYAHQEAFKKRFSEVENTDSVGKMKEAQVRQVRAELGEMVLRRVKRDVEKSLPRKTERILRVELSPVQADCFAAILAGNLELLSSKTRGPRVSLQNVCMQLKKVCNHPLLLRTDAELDDMRTQSPDYFVSELTGSCGKLALLDKLLTRLREKKHRVLIFSQMVRMLDLLSTFLTLRGYRHQRLDGTMSRALRIKSLDQFNDPNSEDFCFLLSTRAGGLGINLTSADCVIIYDSDWNPQNDLQAEARAHRIGQRKTVQIFRLVTRDTVEERILERAKSKMVLDALVVQGLNRFGDGNSAAVPPDELEKILRFGATKLWKKKGGTVSTSPAVEVNLEEVLQEAEERGAAEEQANEGLAEQLQKSFNNISDFGREVLDKLPGYKPIPEEEDPNFWENVVPLNARQDRNEKEFEDLAGQKRSRAKTTRKDDDEDYVADTKNAKPKKRKQQTKAKSPPTPSSSNSSDDDRPLVETSKKPKVPERKRQRAADVSDSSRSKRLAANKSASAIEPADLPPSSVPKVADDEDHIPRRRPPLSPADNDDEKIPKRKPLPSKCSVALRTT